MINVEDVRRNFADFSLNVSFAAGNDEIVTLLGSSGSGKTTTLRIIAGFEALDSGRILIDGFDVGRVPPQERRIGYVFQDYTLFPHLNVAQNIGYGLRAAGIRPAERDRRVRELLEIIELERFGARAVQTLSGGEQQRVAVARALAREPRALLLDEPFSSIDTELREDLRRHLVTVQRALRVPTIFVTHSRSEALAISDRIVVLREGAIEDQGSPQQLYERPNSVYTARFLGRANVFRASALAAVGVTETGTGGPDADTGAADAREAAAQRLLMIRPEHVEVFSAGVAGRARPPGGPGALRCRAKRCTYHGMHREYELESELGIVFVHTREALPSDRPLSAFLPSDHLVPVRADGEID